MTRLTDMTSASGKKPRKAAGKAPRATPAKKVAARPKAAGAKPRAAKVTGKTMAEGKTRATGKTMAEGKTRATGKTRAKAKNKTGRRSLTWRVLRWAMVAGIWLSLALGVVLAWYAYDLPDVGEIAQMTRRPGVTLLSADGSQFAALGDLYGETVSLRDLPPYLPRAVLAVEDRRYYQHFGLDPLGLARAMWVNLRAGRIVQGGSTITQQLAKILFLSPERTIKRKVQEMLLALWLERKFSKDQILALYLNRVYLGAGTYGVDAAARRYFDKPAARVSLYEAALLAGLLKAPSRYNPARHAGRSEARTELVLAAMVEDGAISAEDAHRARSVEGRARARPGGQARYFADWVLSQVGDYIGQVDRDLVVVTTLDPKLQRIAEEELVALLEGDGAKRGAGQAAFVALTPRGAVRAMVGGRDYGESQFNRAVQALRQPGSAFKLFVYLASLERGSRPQDRIVDAPVRVRDWSPKNYGGRYHGEVTLREAFARSLNSVAVRLSERAGRERVASAARRLGITSDLEVAPSLALGASEVTLLELTGAYGVFANRGEGVWPYGIEEIREPDGRILYRRSGGGPGQVVAPRQVSQMADLMSATVEWGTGKAAQPGRPAAGKTGTSQDFRDAWFVGYTADLVAGVWFGNDDGSAMKGVTGGSLPAVLWGRVLRRALADLPPQALPLPTVATGAKTTAGESETAGGEPEGFIDRLLRKLGQGVPSGDAAPGVKRPSPER